MCKQCAFSNGEQLAFKIKFNSFDRVCGSITKFKYVYINCRLVSFGEYDLHWTFFLFMSVTYDKMVNCLYVQFRIFSMSLLQIIMNARHKRMNK